MLANFDLSAEYYSLLSGPLFSPIRIGFGLYFVLAVGSVFFHGLASHFVGLVIAAGVTAGNDVCFT